jgi:putative aldouronate transport system permease protein
VIIIDHFLKRLNRDKILILIILPVVIWYLIFQYVPMYGIIIAFKKFHPVKGILGSSWAGLMYFEQFFNSVYFWRLLKNTVLLSFYSLLFGFPVPIMFALLLNELKETWFKKSVQTVSYLPHFISVVVVVGMIVNFTSPIDGVINNVVMLFGHQPINFLGQADYFRTIYVASGVWEGFGWGSIIYLAAISGIDPQLYEASAIDGAGRWRRMMHVTLPGLMPTIIILFLLNIGSLMDVGYEKVILLYNPATYETSDIIATYVYRKGIMNAEYSFSAAVGLFNNVLNLTLLLIFNRFSRKVSDTSLW